jgi:hypothetical protein
MHLLTLSAIALFLLFIVGDFIGVRRFSIRPPAGTTMWKINLFFVFVWLFAITLLLLNSWYGMILVLFLSFLWLLAQIRAHWIPYVMGAPEEYRQEYSRIFQNTVSILPRLNSRGIVPNLYYTLLFILLALTLILALEAVLH